MLNVQTVLRDKEFKNTLTIQRKSYKVDNKGRFDEEQIEYITISCVIVPSLNTARFVIPEADYQSGRMLVFSEIPLFGTAECKQRGLIGDYFEWYGSLYQVTQVKNWLNQGFIMAYADLVNVGAVNADVY